jgi:hypothetical protein
MLKDEIEKNQLKRDKKNDPSQPALTCPTNNLDHETKKTQ